MANLDDLNATLQDVVRAVNNLNQTLVAGLPVTTLAGFGASDDISVPRSLLELCLGIVEQVIITNPSSISFANDLALAKGQLKAALGE